MIEQISVPALTTCVKMLREGDERAKALLLRALLDIHQSKPMRVNMKESVELTQMKKIDEKRRVSNKEMRLAHKSIYGSTAEVEWMLWFDQEEIVQLRVWNRRNGVQPFHK